MELNEVAWLLIEVGKTNEHPNLLLLKMTILHEKEEQEVLKNRKRKASAFLQRTTTKGNKCPERYNPQNRET